MRKKIEDVTGYEKDAYSKGVVSTDKNALAAYRIQRERIKSSKNLETEVQSLKNDVNEIKQLLSAILTKIN